jgi:hypothetical protein
MRIILLLFILIASVTLKAQSPFFGYNDFAQRATLTRNINLNDSGFNKKWFVSKYSGISTSFSFFKGGNATVVSAPLGLQLNRRLTNNLYAFAGVSAAPAYINFNQTFLNTNTKGLQTRNSFKSNSFGMYSRAEMGLMYVNDAKTFSISGSIGVESNSYPFPYNQNNTSRPNTVVHSNR